jgi:hypothetical protein
MRDKLTVVDGAEAGAWIASRLEGGFGGKVEQQVPNGYEAYVRIFHPAVDRDGALVSWAEVAKALGRTAHREMQWHKLVGSDDSSAMTGSEWPGRNPATGELDPASLEALCGILSIHTADPKHCLFGLSTIFAGVDGAYPAAVQLRLPDRSYIVFSGPLSMAGQAGCESTERERISGPALPAFNFVGQWTESPNLIWPSDHSWYVVSEYDFDSTLVGGSRDLADALMSTPQLETWEVERNDSLEADADKIN